MKFIDLFSGLGGFNIALSKLGWKCVFASEIDAELRELYTKNFKIDCAGDITQIKAAKIPKHDILCAGFPCQPFSKAGKQRGMLDQGRGDMIKHICRILKHHQPKYFILENVPNIKTHNNGKTWKSITASLRRCNYEIKDFNLSPHHFKVPHKRERIFIIGQHKKFTPIELHFSTSGNPPIAKMEKYLEPNNRNHKRLSVDQINCLETWNKFIKKLPANEPIPKFPIWAMEFGATYPLDGKCPFHKTQKELEKYKGAFGCSLKGLPKKEQLAKLPVYARYDEKEFPKWKINYINKNRMFWKGNKKHIKHLLPELKKYVNSWQKLEWNVGDGKRDIFKHLLQFRSSGVRVKSGCSVPSLVLTGTQIPIIGWKKRYISLKEAQKFQGFQSIKIPTSPAKAFAALGNAVNTQVVEHIAKQIVVNKKNIKKKTVKQKKSIKSNFALNEINASQ